MTYAHLDGDAAGAIDAALHGRVPGIAVRTSGSTGISREVRISSAAVRASAQATHARLDGPGTWLLALPAERIAGAMVLARSALAGTAPVVLPDGPFTSATFFHAVERMPDAYPRYTSLVPTQVRRILADPHGWAALETFDAVLVGGAALTQTDVPANVVATYGMTESCGGCVYDGVPLDGVEVMVDATGRVLLAGATMLDGYADGQDQWDGRWWRTQDLGEWVGGLLHVTGRVDDVIVTGGHKVSPIRVEQAVASLEEVADCAVVGFPHPEWGQAVAAVIELRPGHERPELDSVRDRLGALASFERPHLLVVVDGLPLLATGKVDRPALVQLIADSRTEHG